MGKSKPKRHNKQVRDNPTGIIADSKADSEEVVLDCGVMSPYTRTVLSPETLKSLSSQLQSSSVEDRDCVGSSIIIHISYNQLILLTNY